MQAIPGSIDLDPLVPPVHVLPLVQVGATANGSGAVPASVDVTVVVEHPVRG